MGILAEDYVFGEEGCYGDDGIQMAAVGWGGVGLWRAGRMHGRAFELQFKELVGALQADRGREDLPGSGAMQKEKPWKTIVIQLHQNTKYMVEGTQLDSLAKPALYCTTDSV